MSYSNLANPILDELAQALGMSTVAEIVETFAESAQAALDGMAGPAVTANQIVLAQEAHALAGSAACVGLTDLADAARAFENALRSGSVGDLVGHVRTLAELNRQGLRTLAAYVARA